MASPTKQAIVASFLRLAAKKSPDKITVRDIVDDCGVNRNTFYYYFQDIYAVLEALCDDLFASLPEDAPLAVTITQFYATLVTFAKNHPATARSLSLSLGFEGMERYLGAQLEDLICKHCTMAHAPIPTKLELRLMRHALLGICLDALRGGKTPVPSAEELGTLLSGPNSLLPSLGGDGKDDV